MNLNNLDSPAQSATFGQDASFRLEQPIGAMSISPSGRDVVLASKEGLHIIDLDSPYSPPRYLPHRTPWEVADVQWSPFAVRDYWIVSTSNQKALVWNVGTSGWRDAIEFVLHGHTRAITDINFSAHHPDILATCAVDSFVHGWDLRTPNRPSFSFSDWFAGATQVKFSRQDEHVIASSHDRFLHIWDKRKGAYPARTIEAHGTKIYGIDWNRFEPTKIVTCSLDKTIKFWNIDDPEDVPERVIETPFPVWRARHTPFGWGLLAMPQRGSSDLHLYDRRPLNEALSCDPMSSAATFAGHRGTVKEFLWRARGTIKDGVDHRDFQLVSWGNDGELKLHKVNEDTFRSIGYEKGVSRPIRLNFTRRNARYRTFRDSAGEAASPIEPSGRNDSNQSHHYSFLARGRQSTGVAMNRIPIVQFRGWLNGGRRERRTGMHGKSTVRQDMNPIAWMINVKIGSWDSDSLADEVTQVGQRFKKVEFESIDIAQRKVVMSLQGPWGERSSIVYTRADFRFPKAYPKDAAAIVTVYKTSSMDDEIYKTLSTEVRTISETYASRQRGCIEAIVRYLLHEQTMEEIVSWLLGEITDSKMLTAEMTDDLSSDSDDDNPDGNQDPSSSSANLRVPPPKGCGALWSVTGELVCFFPQKPREPTSVLSKFGPTGLESSRLFETFGRLQTSSPARRSGNGTQPTIDDTASDLSDLESTFSSSSSSSSSSDSANGVRDRFLPYSNNFNVGIRHRSRSPDRSNKSTTLDGTKAGIEARLNVVSIHYDMQNLMPSKKSLAEEYRVFGKNSEVCDYNAKVAENALLLNAASVWRLASLILQERVPLEIVKAISDSDEDIAVVAGRGVHNLQRQDSGIDLSHDYNIQNDMKGNIRWGNSPLGAKYLITAIFEHFEKEADIQMLAMLSCVFAQNREPSHDHSAKNIERSTFLRDKYCPSLEVAGSASSSQKIHDRFTLAVTRPVSTGKLDQSMTSPIVQEPEHRRRNTASVAFRPTLVRPDGHGEKEVGVMVDTSNGGTPLAKTTAVSISTSPEDSRFNRRVNSGTPFAASKASLNALAQSFQHSPPSNSSTAGSSLKKFSPSTGAGWAGSLFSNTQNSRASRNSGAASEANSDDASNSNLRGSISFANLQDLRRDSRRFRESRGSLRSTTGAMNSKSGDSTRKRKRIVKTSLHNQHRFDLDGHSGIKLLDPDLEWKYRMYRMAYADQLGAWGLFLQQAELLQFDGAHSVSNQHWYEGSGKARASVRRLEIIKCCIECGSAFVPIEKNGIPIGWHCPSISCHMSRGRLSKNQICSICQHVVKGLSVPCLQCTHTTCYDCAQMWFGGSINAEPDTEPTEPSTENSQQDTHTNPCPTGCGCDCSTLQVIQVSSPPTQKEPPTTQLIPPAPVTRQDSSLSVRSQRRRSETPAPLPGPDTALGAMMALSRSRAPSTTTKHVSSADQESHADGGHENDDLLPWSSGKFTSLGRGIGGGLSRGLSNRSSDATIRRV